MTTKHSPLATDNLGDNAAWPFEDGAEEIVIRVCRYDAENKPSSYQAIVRGRDRRTVWGVGIRANPVIALQRAIENFFEPKAADREAADNANAHISEMLHNSRTGTEYSGNDASDDGAEDPEIEDLLS